MTTLTALHARFGLARNPFPPTPDASAYFFTDGLEAHFAEVLHCVLARKGFVLLTGEVGLGKSTFVRRLLDALPPDESRSALVFNTFLQEEALLSAILRDFGLQPDADIDLALARLNLFLMAQHRCGRTCLLVIDDAQNLSPASLELVRLLCNLETGQEKLLQIVLSGQPELETLLNGVELRQLKSRIVKHARLRSLQPTEVLRYFEMRMTAAGAEGRIGLTRSAARLLHSVTDGNLRRLHLVLDRCLYGLAARGGGGIDRALVRAASDELSNRSPRIDWRRSMRLGLGLGGTGLVALGVAAASSAWRPSTPTPGVLVPVSAPAIAAAPTAAPPVPVVVAVAGPVSDGPGDQTAAVTAPAPAPGLVPVSAVSVVAIPPGAPPALALAKEAPLEPDAEQRCLASVAAVAGGRPMVGQRMPERAWAHLRTASGLCLFQRGTEHWALWEDRLDSASLSSALNLGRVSAQSEALQRALARRGVFDAAAIDGFYGPRSITALGTFQVSMGLPATRLPDPLTYMLLERMDD